MSTRTFLLLGVAIALALPACEADREALDVDGEPADLSPAEEIEAAPQTPMEITEEGDTFPRPAEEDEPRDTVPGEDGPGAP